MLTPGMGFSFSSRTCPARTVCPGAKTVSVLVTVRVAAVPSIVAVPRTSMEELLGVLPVVVKERRLEAFGPRVIGSKVAVTPAGSGPVLRVVRPV
jgi:hypothetical protein